MYSPEGLALYVRHISKLRHGTPKQFAKKVADHGLRWIALAACWQDVRNGKPTVKMINGVDTIQRYADALVAKGVETFVWGYPWQGREDQFVEKMINADGARGRILLDPELGSNPTRRSKGPGKERANAHAKYLVEAFADVMDYDATLGLSTFGGGWRIGWFPLLAFTKSLARHFGGRTFIGGQTYTDDGVIDTSIADMQKVIRKAGVSLIVPGYFSYRPETGVEVVPNFGTYSWNTPSGRRTRGAKARKKRPEELRLHLYEFIDEGEPVDAMIGWAENFVNAKLWDELARFADMMQRGACRLEHE